MQVFHYTRAAKIPAILREGKIRKTTTYFRGDRPAVWVSSNDQWDNGAGCLVRYEGPDRRLFGRDLVSDYDSPPLAFMTLIPARIRINTRREVLVPWTEHRKTIPEWVAERKERGGIMLCADVNEWFVIYRDVPKSSFVAVQEWTGDEWINYDQKGVNYGKI